MIRADLVSPRRLRPAGNFDSLCRYVGPHDNIEVNSEFPLTLERSFEIGRLTELCKAGFDIDMGFDSWGTEELAKAAPEKQLIVTEQTAKPEEKTVLEPTQTKDYPSGLSSKLRRESTPTKPVDSPEHELARFRAQRDYHSHYSKYHGGESRDSSISTEKQQEHAKLAQEHYAHWKNTDTAVRVKENIGVKDTPQHHLDVMEHNEANPKHESTVTHPTSRTMNVFHANHTGGATREPEKPSKAPTTPVVSAKLKTPETPAHVPTPYKPKDTSQKRQPKGELGRAGGVSETFAGKRSAIKSLEAINNLLAFVS